MQFNQDKMVFYIDNELREILELYIIENNLDVEKITLTKFANKIIKEWYKDPKLDEEYIFFSYRKGYTGRIKRLTVFLEESEYINIRRFYIKNYIRKLQSENMMLANVLEQWAIKNIPGYKKKFLEKFNGNDLK